MIYEIVINKNLMSVVDRACNHYKFSLTGNKIYIDTSDKINELKNKLELNDYEYKIINSNNYEDIDSNTIKKWCKTILIKEELEKVENDPIYQERLFAIDNFLNIIESMEMKKEGGENGETAWTTSTKDRGSGEQMEKSI